MWRSLNTFRTCGPVHPSANRGGDLAATALRAVVMNPSMAALIAGNASRRHPMLINVMHAGCLYTIRMMTWQIALLRQTVEVTVYCHR